MTRNPLLPAFRTEEQRQPLFYRPLSLIRHKGNSRPCCPKAQGAALGLPVGAGAVALEALALQLRSPAKDMGGLTMCIHVETRSGRLHRR